MTEPRSVALIAHDKKKLDLAMFAKDHATLLQRFHLIATKTTGTVHREKAALQVECFASSPHRRGTGARRDFLPGSAHRPAP